MAGSDDGAEELAESVHRTILGVLLGMLVIFGIGIARGGFTDGSYLSAIVGGAVALLAGYWILYLFMEAAS